MGLHRGARSIPGGTGTGRRARPGGSGSGGGRASGRISPSASEVWREHEAGQSIGPQLRDGALLASAPQHLLRTLRFPLLPISQGSPGRLPGSPSPCRPQCLDFQTSPCGCSVPPFRNRDPLTHTSQPLPPQHTWLRAPHLAAASCVASRAEAAGALGPILAGGLVSAGAGKEGTVGGRSGTWEGSRREVGTEGGRPLWDERQLDPRGGEREGPLPLLTCLRSWDGPFPHSVGPGSQWHRGRRGCWACSHRYPR